MMLDWIKNRDFLIRLFVITLVSSAIVFITKSNQFDLHFKIRRAQPTTDKVQVIEISTDDNIKDIIQELKEKKVAHVFVNHFLSDEKTEFVTPFAFNDMNPGWLSLEFKADSDGIIRRFSVVNNPKPSFIDWKTQKLTINFRGPVNTFSPLYQYEQSRTDTSLAGKVIILSSKENLEYTTPLGLFNETELMANILDNFFEDRFIPDGKASVQLIILLITLIVSILLLVYLPSTLALVSTFVFAIFYVSLSLWFFDNFTFWTPIVNPLIQMLLTFLLITNYKYVLNEQTKWNLEKESEFFKEVEEMKTNFLSLFSHDLKTPLAKIMGITDTLMSKIKDENLLKELDKINQSSRDLERYIKRILKMSQMQSKNMSLNKLPEDINTLIEKSIDQNKLLASEKGISFIKNLQPLFMLEIDGPLIQEVLVNFIENAITYSPANSQITVSSEEHKNFIRVSVSDQGPGIPKKVQDNIWEKYYRFESEKSGYGLGLFLSRYVIQLHNGQVFLNSKENQGCEFGFILPMNEET